MSQAAEPSICRTSLVLSFPTAVNWPNICNAARSGFSMRAVSCVLQQAPQLFASEIVRLALKRIAGGLCPAMPYRIIILRSTFAIDRFTGYVQSVRSRR